jgi:uncharacterized membrane protein
LGNSQRPNFATQTQQWRSIVKTISWRIIATLTIGGVVYAFTDDLSTALEIGFLEGILKMIFYYLHERSWENISWGQIEHPLADLPVTRQLLPKDKKIIEQRLRELGYM